MTQAASILNRGLSLLVAQFPVPFTLGGFPGVTFTALCESTTNSNEVGEGGFLPAANGTVEVPFTEFAKVNLKPWPGLRLVIHERSFVVNEVGRTLNRWVLRLEQAHPKETDLPTIARVLGTSDGAAIEFTTAGQIEVT